MVTLLQPESCMEKAAAFWRNPSAWIQQQKLSRRFWVFFAAAFFFDAGFSVYFFLFNLYLLDHRFSDRSIGLIGGAMILGTLIGTLPAGVLARRIGVRPVLAFCFLAAPALGILRAVWMWEPAQIGLAFLAVSFGACLAQPVGKVALGWFVLNFLLLSTGELCLAPVGMAMVTQLSPRRIVGVMMGAFFLAYSASSFLASLIARLTSFHKSQPHDTTNDFIMGGVAQTLDEESIQAIAAWLSSLTPTRSL